MTPEIISEIRIQDIQIGQEGGQMYANAKVIFDTEEPGMHITARLSVSVDRSTTIGMLETELLEKSSALLQAAGAIHKGRVPHLVRLGLRSYEDRAEDTPLALHDTQENP